MSEMGQGTDGRDGTPPIPKGSLSIGLTRHPSKAVDFDPYGTGVEDASRKVGPIAQTPEALAIRAAPPQYSLHSTHTCGCHLNLNTSYEPHSLYVDLM